MKYAFPRRIFGSAILSSLLGASILGVESTAIAAPADTVVSAPSSNTPSTPSQKFPAIIVKITSRPASRDVAQWKQEIADDQALSLDIRHNSIPETDWNRIWVNWQSRNGSADRTDAKTRSQALDAELEHLDTEKSVLQHKIENAAMQRSVVGFTDDGQLVQIYANNPMGAAQADALVVGGKYRIVGITENTGNAIHIILEGADPIDVPSAPGAPPQNIPSAESSSGPVNSCFSANELQSCAVSPDGTITAGKQAATLHLIGTEGRDFLITGEIFTGPSASGFQFPPGSVEILLRETKATHCYELGTSGMRVKRILLAGQTISRFAYPIQFKLPTDQWIPIRINVRASSIDATFADQSGAAPGPLSIEGSNSIHLLPGARIRNIQVTIEDTQAVAK